MLEYESLFLYWVIGEKRIINVSHLSLNFNFSNGANEQLLGYSSSLLSKETQFDMEMGTSSLELKPFDLLTYFEGNPMGF